MWRMNFTMISLGDGTETAAGGDTAGAAPTPSSRAGLEHAHTPTLSQAQGPDEM